MQEYITIKGAAENNLKNISLEIPKNKLVVFTGLSGSGKSTLAFDILQRECQRQYMESLGMTADLFTRPKVESIIGLSPSISVDQRSGNHNPRSTVGTVTEVFTYLRILFAKLGTRPCPACNKTVFPDFENASVSFFEENAEEIALMEFVRCPHCGEKLPALTMSHFSFNKPEGACPECRGLGVVSRPNIHLIIDETKSISNGAVLEWDAFRINRYTESLEGAASYYGFTLDMTAPVTEFCEAARTLLLYGALSKEFSSLYPGKKPPKTVPGGRFEGVLTNLMRRYTELGEENAREKIEKVLIQKICPVCEGKRLKTSNMAVSLCGKNIIDISGIPLLSVLEWAKKVSESIGKEAKEIAAPVLHEVCSRLQRLLDVGVGYLSLERPASSLSAGEAQRLRLASLLGSGLTGVLYVLDEPTTGLHARDTARLISVLRKLRDLGNTVLVIEHDVEMMLAADWIIDFGLGAGKHGGEVVAVGTPDEIAHTFGSITAKYINQPATSLKQQCRVGIDKSLSVLGATEHNLKNIDVEIPLGKLVALTGVSGSGKSTLLFDILGRKAEMIFHASELVPGASRRISGFEYVSDVITIDQSPIGRNSRSNAATYTDVFTEIRSLYSALPETKKRKLSARHFSFNVDGGRCEKCEGAGKILIPMHFMPDVEVICPACKGKRFKNEVLAVTYRGHSISDVLNLTVEEATELFKNERDIYNRLSIVERIGLGYLTLGQPATTLSGGEAQRIKLAKELGKKSMGHTLYLLDEPTTGLHPQNVIQLMKVFDELVEQGNSVVVVEHNLDVIRASDWIVDFGPEGGVAGGEIIATGTPLEIINTPRSQTGQALAKSMHST